MCCVSSHVRAFPSFPGPFWYLSRETVDHTFALHALSYICAPLQPKKKAEAKPEEPSDGDNKEANERMPRVMKDKDSMHGGDLYARYQKSAGGSVHSAGNFCSVCGQQVEADDKGDTSIRAGNRFCSKHKPSMY